MKVEGIAAANLLASIGMGTLFAVMISSPTVEAALVRVFPGPIELLMTPALPFLVLGTATSMVVTKAIFLLLSLTLAAAGVGLWRRDWWARKLGMGLLWAGGICFLGSALLLGLFQPKIGAVHLAVAGLMGISWWCLTLPEVKQEFGEAGVGVSKRWVTGALAGGLVVAIALFGATAWVVAGALSKLR
jgi:hypothetical protein